MTVPNSIVPTVNSNFPSPDISSSPQTSVKSRLLACTVELRCLSGIFIRSRFAWVSSCRNTHCSFLSQVPNAGSLRRGAADWSQIIVFVTGSSMMRHSNYSREVVVHEEAIMSSAKSTGSRWSSSRIPTALNVRSFFALERILCKSYDEISPHIYRLTELANRYRMSPESSWL